MTGSELGRRLRVSLAVGAMVALASYVPFLLSVVVSMLLGMSIAWEGQGSVGSAILVQSFQVVLFVLSGVVVRWVLLVGIRRIPGIRDGGELFQHVVSAALVGAWLSLFLNETLRLRLGVPAVIVSDHPRGLYWILGPGCGAVFAFVASCLVRQSGRI